MRLNLKKTLVVLAACLTMPFFALAQNITVSGTVTDASGETVIGAAVMVVNSQNGAVTGVDGTYSLQVSANATLEVSCIGYKTQQIPVQGRSRIDVVLVDDAEQLEATVVIGYGTARRQDVTGSIVSVGGDNLRAVPAGDVTRALEGRVAGVEMTQTSSKPGSSMQIRIRGQRSLSASNDPLIVLDGMPFMGSLTDISPSDIKSMDILKDAASTAIYGSRGANGVILITTYKGVEGQAPKISFNAYGTFKTPVKYPMMPRDKYIEMRQMAGQYKNTLDESDAQFTDWQDLLYRNGYTQNYDLNIAGGTQKGSYRFGMTYYNDEAVIPTQGYNRLALNGSVDQQIGKWFRVGFTTNTSYTTNSGNQVDLYAALSKSPLVVPYDADGNLKWRVNMPSDNDQYIVTRERVEDLTAQGLWVNESKSIATYNTGYVQFNFPWVEGLSFKASVGLNYRNSKGGSFTGVGVNGSATNPNGASWSYNDTFNWTIENLLTYDRTFGKHRINAVALYSAEQTTSTGQSFSGKNIPNELFQYYNIGSAVASDITVNGGSYTQTGLISYMGRVMYSYDDRYMISAAVRSDASSRLAPGHKWHTYPAVSVGWNIHNEKFMAGTRGWLDELKLRVGYGETSNQAISAYATLGRLSTSVYNFADEKYATGYYVSTLPNEDLGWEYSQTWNFGLDFGFFQGRLRGTLEYYMVDTKDILLSLGLPSTSGVSSYTANIGATRNRGIELTLNGTILDKGDWTWTAGLNIYANRNKLVALADGSDRDEGNAWFVGYPLNCIYDYEYDGLWQPGDPYMDILEPSTEVNGMKQAIGSIKVKYHGDYEADGTPKRAIDSNDRVPINAEAIFQGGFNTTVSWKNLDLSVIGSFQAGGILLSSLHSANSYLNMLSGRRGQIDVDYWTPTNTTARYPRPGSLNSSDNPKYASTLAYFNGSYLKIRTITLGYRFHKLPALKRAGIDNLRVYATIQNPGLVLFSDFTRETGLDPEPNANSGSTASGRPGPGRMSYVGYNTPNTRNFLIGVNLTF
ncbi:MAG: TonB-dependent receptor [Bacteroidales bacterium]|nr:TonB-dependent receptor [Bacteroidales bacterium]